MNPSLLSRLVRATSGPPTPTNGRVVAVVEGFADVATTAGRVRAVAASGVGVGDRVTLSGGVARKSEAPTSIHSV